MALDSFINDTLIFKQFFLFFCFLRYEVLFAYRFVRPETINFITTCDLKLSLKLSLALRLFSVPLFFFVSVTGILPNWNWNFLKSQQKLSSFVLSSFYVEKIIVYRHPIHLHWVLLIRVILNSFNIIKNTLQIYKN